MMESTTVTQDRFEELLNTSTGRSMVAELEKQQAHVDRRHKLAAEVERLSEELATKIPELRAKAEEASEAHEAAREQLKDALLAMQAANGAFLSQKESLEHRRVNAMRELRETADPRIVGTVARLDELLRTWHETARTLLTTDSSPRHVKPHPSDPEYERMVRFGGRYRMKAVGTNGPGIERLKQKVEGVRQSLLELALAPEAPGDLADRLSEAERLLGPLDPPAMTWTEPEAPRFDKHGLRVY